MTSTNAKTKEPDLDLDDLLELLRDTRERGLDPRDVLQAALDALDTEDGT